MLAATRIAALGTLGYVTPRILVGIGVPLDEWAVAFGTWLGASRPWVEEWGLTTVAVFCAIVLSGIEAWWRPIHRVWSKVLGRARLSRGQGFGLADLDQWRKVDALEIWRAGCLWDGYNPHYPIPFLDPAYPSFIRLVNAAKIGQLNLAQPSAKIDAWSLVNRSELVRFARSKGEMPEFLKEDDDQDAVEHAPIRRDVWLLDAIHRATTGDWKVYDFDQLAEGKINEFVGVLEKIRQAAFDGHLPIWGKQARSDIWRPIPPEYWEYHGIDWFSMLKGEPENLKTEAKKTTRNVGVWWELMTSRKKVEELWPAANT